MSGRTRDARNRPERLLATNGWHTARYRSIVKTVMVKTEAEIEDSDMVPLNEKMG